LVLAVVIFFGVGRWLVVEDPLVKATAIVVLSGAMPLRAIEAAKLYREGYAPEIWLTHSSEPGEILEEMGIPFAGEDYYDTRVLMHEGVPQEAIHVLAPTIVNTADEIKVVAAALAREKGGAVIIVTTKPHTRRVRLLWRRLAPGHGRAIVRAAVGDPFDPRHWWRTTSDALDVVREVLGLLNAWAGLPLRASSSAMRCKFLLGSRRHESLEKEKAFAARTRQFIFYFWNVRQLSPLEGRERIILEQGARLLFAKPVDDYVVGRLQTERPAARIVRIASHEMDEALTDPAQRNLLGAGAETSRQRASGHLCEASPAYPLFQALRSPAQNAVPLRVSDHGLHTGELNLVQRLVHRRRDRKLVELQKQEIALIDAIGRGILA
jgi:uncharacterized SAM-binding protein YcdF (DUF218 family)